MKKQVWTILFEFLSIVFAVLLALGLNSYKQERDLKNESKVLFEKVVRECMSNKEDLDSVIGINEAYLTYLDSLLSLDDIKGFGFSYQNELLSSTAWKFTQDSRSFQYMDPDFLDDAARLYENQFYYFDISNRMFDNIGNLLIQMDNVKPRTATLTSRYYVENLVATSKELQSSYAEFLEKYQPRLVEEND